MDWDHVQNLYPHVVLRPLFARLLSAPDLIFYQIVHERMGDNAYPSQRPWVVQSETLRRLSQELAVFTDSEDQLLSSRARHCVTSLLVMDIYCQTAILRALSTTRYAKTPGAGKTKDELFFHPQAVLRLRVQRGEAFSSVGHRPIIAGRTANGELAYIAQAFFRGSCNPRNCAVTEGMKPESLRLEVRDKGTLHRRMRNPDSFVVYVLRYEPDAYAWTQDWYGFGVAGLDPTGPFAWRAVK
ncbi:hypothetical protein DFH11DRAFT_1742210 [Phellopilus nigrolimitatus]|nr:hypothetical protein DFH11DRAFT_1742210 [Phellopilus nigrolimitatus]